MTTILEGFPGEGEISLATGMRELMEFYGIRCLAFLGIILMVSFSPSAQLLHPCFHPVAEVGEIMTHQYFCALTTEQGTLSSLS